MLRPLTKVFLAPYPSIGKTCVKLKFLEFAKKIMSDDDKLGFKRGSDENKYYLVTCYLKTFTRFIV